MPDEKKLKRCPLPGCSGIGANLTSDTSKDTKCTRCGFLCQHDFWQALPRVSDDTRETVARIQDVLSTPAWVIEEGAKRDKLQRLLSRLERSAVPSVVFDKIWVRHPKGQARTLHVLVAEPSSQARHQAMDRTQEWTQFPIHSGGTSPPQPRAIPDDYDCPLWCCEEKPCRGCAATAAQDEDGTPSRPKDDCGCGEGEKCAWHTPSPKEEVGEVILKEVRGLAARLDGTQLKEEAGKVVTKTCDTCQYGYQLEECRRGGLKSENDGTCAVYKQHPYTRKKSDLLPCPMKDCDGEPYLCEDNTGVACRGCGFKTRYKHWQALPRISDEAKKIARRFREILSTDASNNISIPRSTFETWASRLERSATTTTTATAAPMLPDRVAVVLIRHEELESGALCSVHTTLHQARKHARKFGRGGRYYVQWFPIQGAPAEQTEGKCEVTMLRVIHDHAEQLVKERESALQRTETAERDLARYKRDCQEYKLDNESLRRVNKELDKRLDDFRAERKSTESLLKTERDGARVGETEARTEAKEANLAAMDLVDEREALREQLVETQRDLKVCRYALDTEKQVSFRAEKDELAKCMRRLQDRLATIAACPDGCRTDACGDCPSHVYADNPPTPPTETTDEGENEFPDCCVTCEHWKQGSSIGWCHLGAMHSSSNGWCGHYTAKATPDELPVLCPKCGRGYTDFVDASPPPGQLDHCACTHLDTPESWTAFCAESTPCKVCKVLPEKPLAPGNDLYRCRNAKCASGDGWVRGAEWYAKNNPTKEDGDDETAPKEMRQRVRPSSGSTESGDLPGVQGQDHGEDGSDARGRGDRCGREGETGQANTVAPSTTTTKPPRGFGKYICPECKNRDHFLFCSTCAYGKYRRDPVTTPEMEKALKEYDHWGALGEDHVTDSRRGIKRRLREAAELLRRVLANPQEYFSSTSSQWAKTLPLCPKCGKAAPNLSTGELVHHVCNDGYHRMVTTDDWLRYVAEAERGVAQRTPCKLCGEMPEWSNGFIYHSCLYPRPDGWLHTCTPAEWIARNTKGEEDEMDKGGKGDICDGHRKVGDGAPMVDGMGRNSGVGCQGGADASGQGSGTGGSRRRDSRRVDHDGPGDAHDRSSRGRDSILCETAPTPGSSVEVATHDNRRDALERAREIMALSERHFGDNSSEKNQARADMVGEAVKAILDYLVNAALDEQHKINDYLAAQQAADFAALTKRLESVERKGE